MSLTLLARRGLQLGIDRDARVTIYPGENKDPWVGRYAAFSSD
jgi:hypothetical protein